ncbi:odorant receptor 4-like isoform X3 [Linepithema humile]|uniref:odorant receptor 4-like isoform X3 n=1 Tax=Linepithema humile TaxID=83485 RepID=UPI00351F2B8B
MVLVLGSGFMFQEIAIDVLYITLIEHCRGLLATVRYCLENALSKNNGDVSIKMSTRDQSYLNVIYIVRRHAETIQFINLINTVFSPSVFLHIGYVTLCLSILGYQLLINVDNSNDLVKYICFINAIIINIFFENWQGQKIIDSSEKVFESVYNTEWYNMPISTRKLLLMIMMRSIKPMVVTASKFMILSYITFNTMMRTSMSYFMLLRSVT